jgi:hypothetical protein
MAISILPRQGVSRSTAPDHDESALLALYRRLVPSERYKLLKLAREIELAAYRAPDRFVAH